MPSSRALIGRSTGVSGGGEANEVAVDEGVEGIEGGSRLVMFVGPSVGKVSAVSCTKANAQRWKLDRRTSRGSSGGVGAVSGQSGSDCNGGLVAIPTGKD